MKDDIIRMAREAKVTPGLIGENGAYFARIEHLVELARADEREAAAKMVDHILKPGGGTWGDAIRARGKDPMPLFDDWPGGWK